ncbi:MAG: sigma-70 family RNA polymerase sigma factor [Proteiniphilum sp.]|jgi:RNA polymerase sigma factor (sigma-70 family)|uniref:RNA polymerase sigma factor n=1 Tax=Proteiniphilum sp. TaxID=1926877 RepID=UPI002B20A061|nr:sigma-70 family RNA polymerase sigma factor [Proteiniphilum sp.]MEA5127503.1 sigma-70 family RNA polymerase sigma factor [Proteiniphilum sp.]
MGPIDLSWRSFVEKGDESSFSIIYNKHVDDLYSYGISLGFQKEMCKDAIQDTFYKLYISKDKLSQIQNITAYIFKSFKHRLIDLTRKNIKEETLDAITESFTVQVTVLDNIIDNEKTEILKKKVISLLNGLTDNQREVVYLKYMIGLEHKEIADIMNIREESARKLLYRTMEKLREQVSEEDFPEVLTILFLLFSLELFR